MDEQVKEELKNRAFKYLDGLEDGVVNATELVKELGPELVDQFLTYNLVYHGLWLAVACIWSLFWIWTFLSHVSPTGRVRKLIHGDNPFDGEAVFTHVVVMVVVALIIIPVFAHNIDDFLKIWLAPHLYVLEWFREFIK